MTEPQNSLAPDKPTPWESRLVNLWQSAEERKGNYWLCISLGATPSWARRMRDWRLSKIERFFHLDETYDPITQTYARKLNTVSLIAPRLDRDPAI